MLSKQSVKVCFSLPPQTTMLFAVLFHHKLTIQQSTLVFQSNCPTGSFFHQQNSPHDLLFFCPWYGFGKDVCLQGNPLCFESLRLPTNLQLQNSNLNSFAAVLPVSLLFQRHASWERNKVCQSVQTMFNHVQWTESLIKKQIIVRWSVWSMFGEQTFAQLRTGLREAKETTPALSKCQLCIGP